uniref:Uncharacterized protein n=1 Tax=Scleropages formosus TaxID=113540 RepID=A0A8C9T4Y0_SCLFO
MVLTGASHLHELHHIRMVEFLQDGDLLVNSFQGPLGLGRAFGSPSGPSGRGPSWCGSLTTSLPPLQTHVIGVVIFVVCQLDNPVGALGKDRERAEDDRLHLHGTPHVHKHKQTKELRWVGADPSTYR